MLKASLIDPIVKLALKEDVGAKDITSSSLIPRNHPIKATIQMKQDGVLCGMEIAERVFRLVDENVRFLPVAKDGETAQNGREIAYLEGSAISVLVAERTALNFLSQLSGISTKTREFVDKVKGTGVKILDSRKTTPGLRFFEKYAVTCGGGTNQRFGLFDQVLIKDNHLEILNKKTICEVVLKAKQACVKNVIIGVETKSMAQAKEALKSKADYILLDNMSPEKVAECVALKKKTGSLIALEVSGGITLDNVMDYAKLGVDRISMGCITHSAPAIDISLDIVG